MQDVAQLIPELQPSIVASVRPSAHSSQDVEQARFRLFESIATMFKVLAGLRPLMLVVEDLHDADQPSLVMLRFVVRQLKNAPLMVVGNYRDAEVQRSPILSQLLGDLVREGAPVPLLGLNREGAAQMIEERAAAPCSPKLISDIHQATAGNPLFIDGLVRVLAADGTLSSTNRLDLAAFRVPDGVREAIRRWLGVLSDRSSLVIAATIGQQFELRCLQRVTQLPNHHLLDTLREARAVGVVTPVSHDRYRFTHALIRNAMCDELNSADRAEVHLKIGEAIEELYRVNVEVHTAALAHHFREGGDIDKAIDYSIRAGEAACAVFAYEEALAHWQAALNLMPARPEGRARRAELLEQTAELLGLTASEGAEQFNYLRQALKLYKDLGRPQAAARVEARSVGWLTMRAYTGDVSNALERDEKAESLLLQTREGATSVVWRHIAEATAAGELVEVERELAASRRAMELSEQLGDQVLRARAAITHASGLFAIRPTGLTTTSPAREQCRFAASVLTGYVIRLKEWPVSSAN
jgi:predicted ATPase